MLCAQTLFLAINIDPQAKDIRLGYQLFPEICADGKSGCERLNCESRNNSSRYNIPK